MRNRLLVLVVMLVALGLLGGCGVMMNAEYSQLLDQTAALSSQFAERLEAGDYDGCNEDDMDIIVRTCQAQAYTWIRFQNARDGVSEGGGD